MRVGRFTIDRAANDFQLVDHDGGLTILLTRSDARFLFCWLMHRLNVKDAELIDGRKVSSFYHFDKVLEMMHALENDSNKPARP